MGKFRSKLKRRTKGKNWVRGHSSTSNPEKMKHRVKAKSQYFQSNLNTDFRNTGLTLKAVLQHEQREAYNTETTTVNDVAGSLKLFNLNAGDDSMSESQEGTFKTFETFASNFSVCGNMSFNKLLSGFRVSSELHKEMLAILTALTEIIKDRGGSESSTEYFILLIKQIESSEEEIELTAGVSLLAMGIKTVPVAVLCKRFEETAQILLVLLQRFVDSSNQSIIRYIIQCLSVLLRVQDYTIWTYSSTWQYIDAILSFTVHSKPKIRKAAQNAIISIIHGSKFMMNTSDIGVTLTSSSSKVKCHPASNRVTKFCINQFQPEMLTSSQNIVLYTLALLKGTINGFKTDDIRSICEYLLSIMTAANVLIRTNCLQTLHALFESRTINLNSSLCGQLLAAIHEYRPDPSDVRQTLAWLTVLKEGHIHLAALDLHLCINALPHFIEVCIDMWVSDHIEIISGVSNCLKDIFYECVRPSCATQELADIYHVPISRIINFMNKMLCTSFGNMGKYVILSFSIMFEVCGEYFRNELGTAVQSLAKRYDTESPLRIHIEHALITAISSMGPESVLANIPLTNNNGEVMLERSWLLPLLREGISGATFIFFKNTILPLALDCNTKWHYYAKAKEVLLSHTYELLCCQLWGLFPGFCCQPKDPENFRLIASTLGNALDNNPEFRAPIFDGFIELIKNANNTEVDNILSQYSKNFLPRLFNIYTQKPDGTYAAELRSKSLEVIELYLTKTQEDVLEELYKNAYDQLSSTTIGSFEYEAIFDITAALVLYQSCDVIRQHFETIMVPILKNEKSKLVSNDEQKLKKQQRKVYDLLRAICTCDASSCQKFNRQNSVDVQKLLLEAFTTSCAVCQASRLKCLKIIMENQNSINSGDKIVMKAIPEAVISYKEFSTRKENVSEEIIKYISNLYFEADKLNDFIDILTAGFAGDELLITNTILVFRTVIQNYGKNITIATMEFILQQVLVFLVQRSRIQAEASIAFLITFIKVLPTPLIAKHLESIMQSLSAMAKDTKRYCRIQIGYLLKKLCKLFNAEELIKFVPGDDEVTHRRLKKIRKKVRRDTRQKLIEENDKDICKESTEVEFGLQKKSITIDDILADSDSESDDEVNESICENVKISKTKLITQNAYIREDPGDIVDLADIKSIGNVLTNHPNVFVKNMNEKAKDINRGFKIAEDGRLIISDKALRNVKSDDNDSENMSISEDTSTTSQKIPKRGMEENSSDEEKAVTLSRKRKLSDGLSIFSGKTTASRYTTSGKGIHRSLGAHGSDGVSTKSSKSARADIEHPKKKAQGNLKKRDKFDPYAYIPLDRRKLNKRRHSKISGTFKNIVKGAHKGE